MKLRVALALLFAASFLSAPAKPPMDWESLMIMKGAAERGDPQAQFLYGMQVSVGDGIAANQVEAAAWFKKAALAGLSDAQYALGMLYSDPAGKVFDPIEAEVWLEKAAQQGNAQAIARLGVLLSRGGGRNRAAQKEPDNSPGSPVAAKNETANSKGFVTAVPVQASGDSRKMDEDPETTVRWSLILSGLRGVDAYVVRGYLLENGVGMMRDEAAAADAYRHAAELGSAPAQFRLGQLYADGRGIGPDLAEACYWLRLASVGGSREASAALAALLLRLDKEQLAVADRLGRERVVAAEKK
jgi:TPR repeat protein